jgi:TIR domain
VTEQPEAPRLPTQDLPEPVGNADARAPLFFVSYAHSVEGYKANGRPQAPNRRFIRFFDDLSENVAELVSRPTGSDPGYMDRSMHGGVRWTTELLGAIGTCQVFVALLSAPYFVSPWCSKEWYAFSTRKVYRQSDDGPNNQTAIIPVIWATLPHDRIPAVVGTVQRFSPTGLGNSDISALYEENGVGGLLRTRQKSAYRAVVWQLAQRIARIHYSHRVDPGPLKESELRDIFREQET